MELFGVALILLIPLGVIILSGYIMLKLLGDLLNVSDYEAYIDEETEGYINGPNGIHG